MAGSAGAAVGALGAWRRHRRWLLLLLAGVGLALASSLRLGSAGAAPGFALTSQAGQPVSLADLRGRPVLLTFLYTHCPDVCPLTLATTEAGLRTIAADGGSRPAVVVVTVDPDRDTVERLRAYAGAWPADWLFLTGTPRQLASVWRAYGVTVEKRPLPHSTEVHVRSGYALLHTSKLVLVDGEGRVSDELTGAWTPAELAARLRTPARPPTIGQRLYAGVDALARVCGEFAATQPGLAAGVVALLLLPGLLLPLSLRRSLIGAPRSPAGRARGEV